MYIYVLVHTKIYMHIWREGWFFSTCFNINVIYINAFLCNCKGWGIASRMQHFGGSSSITIHIQHIHLASYKSSLSSSYNDLLRDGNRILTFHTFHTFVEVKSRKFHQKSVERFLLQYTVASWLIKILVSWYQQHSYRKLNSLKNVHINAVIMGLARKALKSK